jgi:hypothetical protein
MWGSYRLREGVSRIRAPSWGTEPYTAMPENRNKKKFFVTKSEQTQLRHSQGRVDVLPSHKQDGVRMVVGKRQLSH